MAGEIDLVGRRIDVLAVDQACIEADHIACYPVTDEANAADAGSGQGERSSAARQQYSFLIAAGATDHRDLYGAEFFDVEPNPADPWILGALFVGAENIAVEGTVGLDRHLGIGAQRLDCAVVVVDPPEDAKWPHQDVILGVEGVLAQRDEGEAAQGESDSRVDPGAKMRAGGDVGIVGGIAHREARDAEQGFWGEGLRFHRNTSPAAGLVVVQVAVLTVPASV